MAFARNGYGQVEANQLSAQKTGQIYASLPLDTAVTVLQNGEFMYYDYADGKVTATQTLGKNTEPMLVFNEVKLYEEPYRTTYKDFAMIKVGENYVTSDLATAGYGDGATTAGVSYSNNDALYRMDGYAPRLFKTAIGDLMTTNMVATGDDVTYAVGDTLTPTVNASTHTLVLTKTSATEGMLWQVVKTNDGASNFYTLPDGQAALKLQRIQ